MTSLWDGSDLFQLIVISELVEQNDGAALGQCVTHKKPFTCLNRYNKIMRKYANYALITDVKKGSIEMTIMGISTVANIIIPIVVGYVNQQMAQSKKQVNFNVSVADLNIQKHLAAFERKVFGTGEEGLKVFFQYLKTKGYDVQAISDHSYNISIAVNKIANRMVNTLKIN
jgi:hypothetical protein